VLPGAELWSDRQRSGVGRLGRRPDIAALVVLLVFGAFANAAGMVGPVAEAQERLAVLVGIRSPLVATTAFYLLAVIVLPLLAVVGAATLSRRLGRLEAGTLEVATRYAYALVPLGFGMWLAHYCFHFLKSYDTAVPTAQRFLHELGWTALGEPHWVAACCRPVATWLPRLEILFLDLGLLLSLYTCYRITLIRSPRLPQALAALAPWALLIALLFAAGIWLVFQPMQMRGTVGA
jgi:hypothetical protein